MKLIFLTALIVLFTQFSFAQITTAPKSPEESDISFLKKSDNPDVFTLVERMPAWQGCDQSEEEEVRMRCSFMKVQEFLARNIIYPATAKNYGIMGTVYITFIINTYGQVVEPKVLRGVNEELDNEALRVVRAMPVWVPAIQDGKNVMVQYNIPIKFTLR